MLTVGGTVLIMTAADQSAAEVELASRRAALVERGAVIEELPASETSTAVAAGGLRLSLPDVLDRLGEREINELWVEAGPRLAGALLRQIAG